MGWPEDWYGDYYDDHGLTHGNEYPGGVLIPPGLANIELGPNTLVIERFYYMVDSETTTWTFATELDGDVVRVLPPEGGDEWKTLYPGADEVLIRPGDGCTDLVFEVHGPEPYDPPWLTPWHRGTICVTDPYDDSVCCDRWSIDLCPGAVTTCEP